MKQRKNPPGTVIVFLKTDLGKAKPVPPEKMDEVQRRVFAQMKKEDQQRILEGYGTVVMDIESERPICKFNMEHYVPPKEALKSFARQILPSIEEFYAHEENRRASAAAQPKAAGAEE